MIAFVCTLALLGGVLLAMPAQPRPPRVSARARSAAHPAQAVAAGVGGALGALLVTALPVFAGIAGLAAAMVPGLLRRRREAALARAAAAAWPSLLDDLTSGLRAGSDLPQALDAAGRRAPAALQPAFAAFSAHFAMTGSFERALDAMAAHCDDPAFRQLRRALRIARVVGGHDLTRVLRSLSAFVRSDLQVRGELAARQSWTINSARLAVAAPWIVLLLLGLRGSTVDAYRTPEGALVLAAVALLCVIAYAAMLRLARLDGSSA